jgi:Uracil DNA glycosylase superfamily
MTLGDPAEIARRHTILRTAPHSVPLADWVDIIAARRAAAAQPAMMPYIDPLDAGTDARVVLILEAPGPMTNAHNAKPGSGFISSDNADPTARNLWDARRAAGLIDGVLIWNAVPWYLGPTQRKPTTAERASGALILRELITKLPELHTIVPLGRHAQGTWRRYGRPGLGAGIRTIDSWHSGAQAMNQPGKRAELVAALSRATAEWRHVPAGTAEIGVDRDRTGATVAQWYIDGHGDRIDIHPRWW